MRVLQVHCRYRESGGEDSVVATERRLLESAGHEVETHLEHNPETVKGSLVGLAVSPWNSGAARRVVRTAESFGPDVVHIHNTWFRLSPAVVRGVHEAGLPTVVTMHNYRLACLNAQLYRDGAPCEDCVGNVPWRGVTRRCYRDSTLQSAAVATTVMLHRSTGTWKSHVDVVIALTNFAAERLVASGVPADRIVVKGNTVNDPGPRPRSPSKSDYVLFAGRISHEKGIIDLLGAWEPNSGHGLELHIAGEGPLESEVRRRLPPGVRLLGRHSSEEIRRLLLGARALVFTSRMYEGQPMILLEAMSTGTPVVYPLVGAIPELMANGGWGFVARNESDLRRRLEGLDNSREVDRRGRAARSQFESRFSSQIGLKALEDVYEQAIGVHDSTR